MIGSKLSQIRLAATLLLAGGISFTIFNTIAESFYPGYNLRSGALSDLGALGQPTALLWDSQLFVTGLLLFLGNYLLFGRSSLIVRKRKLVTILYLLPPSGTILVSLFPENTLIAVHTLGAFISFTFGGISTVYACRFTKSPFRYFAVLLGLISLAFTSQLGNPAFLGFGLTERLVLYPLTIWGIAFAGYLMSLQEGVSDDPGQIVSR